MKLGLTQSCQSELSCYDMKTAFVFPGQGAQYAGMGQDLYDKYPAARQVFDEADRALGFSLSSCVSRPEEDLKLTENTQPAILTISVAAFRVLEEKGCLPGFRCRSQPGRIFGAGRRRRV